MASTSAVDAIDNTGTTPSAEMPGVPIYWLTGAKVADDYADFYDNTWDSLAAREESGRLRTSSGGVATGSTSGGSGYSGQVLGTGGGQVRYGSLRAGQSPLSYGRISGAPRQQLYGLSPVLAVVPVVTVAAGAPRVIEGNDVVFWVRLSSAPDADLDVSVVVGGGGDFDVAADSYTVTIPAGETAAALRLSTAADSTDDSDAAVTATLGVGAGYAVGTPGSVSVTVTDDKPEVSISAHAGTVVEGDSALFVVSASPAPGRTWTFR